MRFNTEDEAWEYWLDMYEYEDKYEGLGRSFNDQVDMFLEWVEENNVIRTPNMNLQD